MRTPLCLLTLLLSGVFCGSLMAAERKPNILVILADDLGWGELGCQGFTQQIPTPHIDSIASRGVRFTSGYVSGPYCSPTRAGLMTGRYQQRFGHEFNPGPEQTASKDFGLPLTETTIGNRLQAAGYATGWFGKSHLGYEPPFHPLQRGFDEFYGFLGGAR
ncbi:MAG: sulfatase-like hydrolase/transferase, partial [Pirellulaceae bacterium]|nr:sulfatase-like hydrolase/transferase [Pirellulaceae bacterium]